MLLEQREVRELPSPGCGNLPETTFSFRDIPRTQLHLQYLLQKNSSSSSSANTVAQSVQREDTGEVRRSQKEESEVGAGENDPKCLQCKRHASLAVDVRSQEKPAAFPH